MVVNHESTTHLALIFKGGMTSGGWPAENLISPLSISDFAERLSGETGQFTRNRRRR
jgi:hypothetical protein